MDNKYSLNPVSFEIALVIALASVLVVTTETQITQASRNLDVAGGAGGAAGLLGDSFSDLDVEEATQAENTTMAGATNQTTTNGNTIEFLSIQTAQTGSISQINATAYALELNNVADNTILFSGRPERVVASVSTSDFVGNWTAGQNSFSADEPNDVLIVENTQTGQLETAIVESSNPVYDPTTNTLTYTVRVENATTDLPGEFGQAVLVIDDTGEEIVFELKGTPINMDHHMINK